MNYSLLRFPFLRLSIPFVLGIILQYQIRIQPGSGWIDIVSFGLLFILALSVFIKEFKLRWVFGFSITCLSFWTAFLLTSDVLGESSWNLPDREYVCKLQLLDDPVLKPRTWMCKAKILGVKEGEGSLAVNKRVIIYLSKDSLSANLKAGDGIIAKVALKKPVTAKSYNGFDYASYLEKQGFAAIGYVKSRNWQRHEFAEPSMSRLKFAALSCRRSLIGQLKEMIPEERLSSVASALLFGYQDEIDKDLRETFSSVGVAHVLSVSGLHVGIIYGLLCFVFSLFASNRIATKTFQLLILSALWVFAFLTGLSSPVVRASIMICFAGLGMVLNRQSLSLNSVAASGLFMLIYNPMYLFDVGFQLSYAAVISIVVINPLIVKLFEPSNPLLKYTWNLMSVSTAAQAGTFPLTLYYFHQFPLLFIVTNLFAIPVSGILVGVLPFFLALHSFVKSPGLIYLPVNKLLEFFVGGVEWLKIPYLTLIGISIEAFDVFILYLMLISFVKLLVNKRVTYACLLILFVIVELLRIR